MISVIIPTYNEVKHIKSTIHTLMLYDADNLIKEIIVADGGSTDDHLECFNVESICTGLPCLWG